MSGFAGRPRKGCHECGKFVMALDDARGVMRHKANIFAKNPTPSNRKAAQRAKEILDETKKYHDEHKLEHEAMEETGDK